jgi:Uncharacterized membrane protein (homolog of Drosophila rhomboid)
MFPLGDDNPTLRTPIINWLLIAINIIVFLAQLQQDSDFTIRWSFIPLELSAWMAGQAPISVLLTIVTSMFLHGGIGHIAGNLLFLWIFGDNVEDRIGHITYLWFYLLCGVGATLIQYSSDRFSPIPNVGASGAISGVLAAYMVMFPLARVRLAIWPLVIFFGTIPIPAFILVGLWFFMQLSAGYQEMVGAVSGEGGVAYWAHVGGFVVGFVLIFFVKPRRSAFYQPYR